jgi:predicted ATP-dependent protease
MIEQEGTTPAQQVSTTPVPVTFDSLDSALAKIEELTSELASTRRSRDYYVELHSTATDTIENARKLIQEILAGDMDAEGTFDAFREPFELLEVSLERDVEVEITVTWRGTMTVPFNVDPDDLDDYDFSADLESDRYPADLSLHDFKIQER